MIMLCGTTATVPARHLALNPETRNECSRCVESPVRLRWGDTVVLRKRRGLVQHYAATRVRRYDY